MMKTTSHPARVHTLFPAALVVAGIAAAGLWGCSSSQCQTSADCPAGQICNTTGSCIAGNNGTPDGGGSCGACSGATPVCDSASGQCVTCTASQGCPAGESCDTSVTGGRCVGGGCQSDRDCTGAAGVCDLSTGNCVVCTAAEGCPGGSCDTSVAGGRCVTNSGCTGDGQCSGATPVCDTASGQCVVCTSTDGCTTGQTCQNDACVANSSCTGDGQCSGAAPVCNTASGQCVVCTSTDGCSGATSKCDTTTAGGKCVACLASTDCSGANGICSNGACVACTAAQGCSGATPKCDTTADKCVQCLSNGDCSGQTPSCQDGACVAGTSGTGSAAIAAARTAAVGPNQSLAISGVFVTYLKPAVGSDKAGFFIQAEQAGPALFVQVDPSTLSPAPAVGDGVSFTATDLEKENGLTYVNALTGFARASTGNAVSSLVKDVSAASDVLTNIDNYESRLVKVTGSIATAFTPSGSGHLMAQITTTGMPTASANFVLRVEQSIPAALDLAQGCTFTLTQGPMWRFTTAGTTPTTSAEPTSYSASDFTGISSCPAPQLLSANATAATTVVLTFDRHLDPSSVQADGSQFTITGGNASLSVSGATASGTTVTVTTGSQTAGTSYTVTVATTVKDTLGSGVAADHANATFAGFGGACNPAVVISQVFGGGGSTSGAGAPFNEDYVELHNRGTTAVAVDGWTIQYASASTASGTTTWHAAASLTGSIAPGGFYLVGEHTSSTGAGSALPTPDATGSQDLSQSSGNVALVNTATVLGSCTDSSIVDLVVYGSGPSTCAGGSGAVASLSNTTAAVRKDNGCTDTNVNQADFDATTPDPHNSSSTAAACGCQ